MEPLERLNHNLDIISKLTVQDLYERVISGQYVVNKIGRFNIGINALNFATCGASYFYRKLIYSHRLNNKQKTGCIILAIPLTLAPIILGASLIFILILAVIGVLKGLYEVNNQDKIMRKIKSWCYKHEINICLKQMLRDKSKLNNPEIIDKMQDTINFVNNQNSFAVRVLTPTQKHIFKNKHLKIFKKLKRTLEFINNGEKGIKALKSFGHYNSIADRNNWVDYDYINNFYIGPLQDKFNI